MNTQEVLLSTQRSLSAGRVFGDPVEVGNATIIPVASVAGGGGGGQGTGEQGGAGFGLRARPAGVFAIRDGRVTWHPALNLNLVIFGGQVVALAGIFALRGVVRAWLRHRDSHAHTHTPPAM
jgi:hypothetical protein